MVASCTECCTGLSEMRRTKAAGARAAAAAAEAANSDSSEAAQSPGKVDRADRVASELRIKEMLKELHQYISKVQVAPGVWVILGFVYLLLFYILTRL